MSQEKKEQIRLRLAELEAANDGRLTPSAVIEDAKSEDSPLHDQFEWDKDKAAYHHWLDQARHLITSVRVEYRTDTTVVTSVYYTKDPTIGHKEQGYVSVARLRTDSDMARDALVSEFSRVADMLRRAREMARVLDLYSEVDQIMNGVVDLRERVIEQQLEQQMQ